MFAVALVGALSAPKPVILVADVGIDDALLAKNTKMQADEEIIEMMNGCICCTVRQDLIVVLEKLAKRQASGKLKLDAIIIETTGMADPGPVAESLWLDEALESPLRLDGIVAELIY